MELLENHRIYLKRLDLFKKFGYEIEKEKRFIIEKSKPISGKILSLEF